MRTRIEIACADLASAAGLLDSGFPKRSQPKIVLLPDGRLRYTDTARHDNETVYSVLGGISVGFNAERWRKISEMPNQLHYRRSEDWGATSGALDARVSAKEVTTRVVEAIAVIETVESVT